MSNNPGVANNKLTIGNVLEAINIFSSNVDDKFSHIDDQFADLKKQMDERFPRVYEELNLIKADVWDTKTYEDIII